MRIGLVVDFWGHPYNGGVVSARRFTQALLARGFEFTVCCVAGGEGIDGVREVHFRQLQVPGANRIIDRMRAPLALPNRARLLDGLADVDLLPAQFPFPLSMSAIGVARKLGKPVLASFHVQAENILQNINFDNAPMARKIYEFFNAKIYGRADRVIAPSQFAKEILVDHGLTVPVDVLTNGIPDRFFAATAPTGVEPTGVEPTPTDRLRVLSVGRMAKEKAHDQLLRAIASSRLRDAIDVTLIGTGPMLEPLQALASALGLDASIGPVDDATLFREYARADLFVHAGRVELEGMSVMEAMAAGKTVIVSDAKTSASRQFVDQPMLTFRDGDIAHLRHVIEHWLSRGDARRRTGLANRERATKFRHGDSVSRLAEIYHAAVA